MGYIATEVTQVVNIETGLHYYTSKKIVNIETGLNCYRINKNCKYSNWFTLLQK